MQHFLSRFAKSQFRNSRNEPMGQDHNKWICGSELCMYVWERLHVQGRRIPGRVRRTKFSMAQRVQNFRSPQMTMPG